MFKNPHIFIFILLCCSLRVAAQSENPKNKTSFIRYYTLQPDSTVCVHLNEVMISIKNPSIDKNGKKIPRKYRKGTRAYNRTIRNLKVVYPLAKKAAKKIHEIELQLKNIQGEKAKRTFVKKEYKKLMKIYKEPMKNMRISQGRMLIVLIHRETGNTSYEHIKNYKGGITAFFWQGIARLFGNNLKKSYNPNGEDRYLEALIQQYERGEL